MTVRGGRAELPLRARVAEALGWRWKFSPSGGCRFLSPPTTDEGTGFNPDDYEDAPEIAPPCRDALRYVPRYDTSWASTGPIIERYGITLENLPPRDDWRASRPGPERWHREWGKGPLEAVCNLILALAVAGTLPPSQDLRKASSSEPTK